MVLLHTDSFPYRADITDAFRKEGLTFLRYGGTMVNAPEYMTRNMHGPSEERPPYIGHYYRYSTNGFGIIEFVRFARLIGTEPTFAINIEDNAADVLALLRLSHSASVTSESATKRISATTPVQPMSTMWSASTCSTTPSTLCTLTSCS